MNQFEPLAAFFEPVRFYKSECATTRLQLALKADSSEEVGFSHSLVIHYSLSDVETKAGLAILKLKSGECPHSEGVHDSQARSK